MTSVSFVLALLPPHHGAPWLPRGGVGWSASGPVGPGPVSGPLAGIVTTAATQKLLAPEKLKCLRELKNGFLVRGWNIVLNLGITSPSRKCSLLYIQRVCNFKIKDKHLLLVI